MIIIKEKLTFEEWSKSITALKPRCMQCGTLMEHAYDKIAKEKSNYLWKFKCKCNPKNQQLAIG